MEIKEAIKLHINRYPESETDDIFKLLYQSVFGCDHFVISKERATERIISEASGEIPEREDFIEDIGGNYSRIYLNCIEKGISPETLAAIFELSSKEEKGIIKELEKGLEEAYEIIGRNDDFKKAAFSWKKAGYPSIHHSDRYKAAYKPAYRVVSNKIIPFLPIIKAIDSAGNKPLTVAIEGGSASGKTTLSAMLAKIYGAAVFHTDDYFLRPHQRTKERLAETGGNFDRERFLTEILLPLKNGETVSYSRFDCKMQTLRSLKTVAPARINIIEGAYSMHPELRGFYDLTVFLDIDKELQKARVTARNGEMASRFFNEWIPLEDRYFEELDIKKKADIIIKIGE